MGAVRNDKTNPLFLIPILSQLQSWTTEQSIPPLIHFRLWNLIPLVYVSILSVCSIIKDVMIPFQL